MHTNLQARASRPTLPHVHHHRRPSPRPVPLRYKSEGSTDVAPKQQQQQQQVQQQVQLSADDVMADMCTMLGGISTDCFTGYAGQWRTWEVLPTQQLQQQPTNLGPDDTPSPTASTSSNPDQQQQQSNSPSVPPTATCTTSSGQHSIQLIDDSINVRLWRRQQQEGGATSMQKAEGTADSASSSQVAVGSTDTIIQQANFYHHPVKMAGPSTRFAPYLTGNTMAGRPDGYGLRVWSFTRDSDMLKPDASSWLDGSSTPAECSMRVLTVPGRGTTIVNGALPSGFGEGHNPRFWVLEFIAKDPGSSNRRWASMNWYDLGQLVVNRSIHEDRLQLAGEPDDICIDPNNIHFSERREGLLPLNIDAWASQHTSAQHGSATVFSWASVPGEEGAQELHLTRSSDTPCTWSNSFSATTSDAVSTSSSSSSSATDSTSQQQEQQQREKEQEGGAAASGGVDVVVQVYPDWSYCRVPRSIEEVVGSGLDSAVFEAGTVLSDGSLVRWLLEYETAGRRLIRNARFETYPPAAA